MKRLKLSPLILLCVSLTTPACCWSYVTSDTSGSHIFADGDVPAFFPGFLSGLDHVGVGELVLSKIGSTSAVRCSGALLPSREHVLTAAHCFTDGTGAFDVEAAGSFVTFHDSVIGFPIEIDIAVEELILHPSYDGDSHHGFDFGIVKLDLASPLSMDIPDYPYASGPFIDPDTGLGEEIGVPTLKAGFGSTGFGATGAVSGTGGDKRLGLNLYEPIDLSPVPGIESAETQIIYDFDSGMPANDGGDVHFALGPDAGFGDDEVGAGTGDSGGPTFIQDPDGTYVIVGTTSYGLRFIETGGLTSDVDGIANESWGEFVVDGRVAAVAPWIDSIVLPEPRNSVFMTGILFWFARLRRRETVARS